MDLLGLFQCRKLLTHSPAVSTPSPKPTRSITEQTGGNNTDNATPARSAGRSCLDCLPSASCCSACSRG